jgi:putative ABC transport system ATP-binding protein
MTFLPQHKRSRQIGRLFQDPLRGTAPNMSIEENLALAYLRTSPSKAPFSRLSKADRELFRARLRLLDMGLADRMRQPVGLLSGGQRQALTLLMATIVPPKLLLLDEHTAALDPKTAQKVLRITDTIINEHKLTALMVTHNMKDAITHGNRLIMMHEGKIIFNVSGEAKKRLTVKDLMQQFEAVSGEEFASDKAILA